MQLFSALLRIWICKDPSIPGVPQLSISVRQVKFQKRSHSNSCRTTRRRRSFHLPYEQTTIDSFCRRYHVSRVRAKLTCN